LEKVDEEFVKTYALVDALISANKLGVRVRQSWWDRLWSAAVSEGAQETFTGGEQFYGRVINSSGGRLTEHLLQMIDARRRKGAKPARSDLTRLRAVMRSPTPAGHLGRGALAHDFGFVWSLNPSLTRRYLVPWLGLDSGEGRNLRAVLTQFARLQADAFQAVKAAILRGVQETDTGNMLADHVAAQLLFPVLSSMKGDPNANWGLAASEVRQALGSAKAGVREGAALRMRQWLAQMPDGPAESWRKLIGPLFRSTWPADRIFRDEACTRQLAELCVGAGEAFPEVFTAVQPYLATFEQGWANLHFLQISQAPEQFPQTTLELVWTLCGPPSRSMSTDLAPILDRVAAAKPKISVDRRFQWLEDRAYRRGLN
jgi:hypothetical protein